MPKALLKVQDLKKLYKQIKKTLEEIKAKIARTINKSRLKGLTFKEGDKVYLLYKNIKTKRLSDKLNYKKLRLFKVTK